MLLAMVECYYKLFDEFIFFKTFETASWTFRSWIDDIAFKKKQMHSGRWVFQERQSVCYIYGFFFTIRYDLRYNFSCWVFFHLICTSNTTIHCKKVKCDTVYCPILLFFLTQNRIKEQSCRTWGRQISSMRAFIAIRERPDHIVHSTRWWIRTDVLSIKYTR